MAKAQTKQIEIVKPPEPVTGDPSAQLDKFLQANKTEHFNFVEDTDYLISTGSLNLDAEIGGFRPGLVRLCGNASAGKTSFALNTAANFLKTVPNSRVLYVKAESRLSREIQNRCGLTFVKDPSLWQTGNVFVLECNVYEVVIGLLRSLITNNPTKVVYMFIVDSMDALNLRGDMAKAIDEANRVAAGPLITQQFLQKISVAMTKYGHLCFFLSQVRAEIKLDLYAKASLRQVASAGGSAVQHFASNVLFFQDWHEGDLILENPDARVDRLKNRSIGHLCKVKISKADQEKRHITVEIPIKHGVINGTSIWREREIADQLLGWGLITKGGSWLTFADILIKELTDQKLADIPEKVQGMNQLYAWLESRQDIVEYLFGKLKAMIGTKR